MSPCFSASWAIEITSCGVGGPVGVSSEIESFGAGLFESLLSDFHACGISETAAAKYFTGFRSGEISALGRDATRATGALRCAGVDIVSGERSATDIPDGPAMADVTVKPTAHTPAPIVVSQSLATTRSPCDEAVSFQLLAVSQIPIFTLLG
jgi:hypothetical protein